MEGARLTALFPCKPERLARIVPMAGTKTAMRIWTCDTGGATFAVSQVTLDKPASVVLALEQLQGAAVRNIGATPNPPRSFEVHGLMPNVLARRMTLEGHGADGKSLREEVAFFSDGLQVYQATVFGRRLGADVPEAFFEGLSVTP